MKSKLDLSVKVAGATRDVASFENNKTRLFLGGQTSWLRWYWDSLQFGNLRLVVFVTASSNHLS